MVKNITCSVDESLHTECQELRVNISELLNLAMKKRLNQTEVKIEKSSNCEFCGTKGTRENIDEIDKRKNGLSWFYPYEKWICNECLSAKSRHILK